MTSVTLMAAKGGVGATLVAVNLAVGLAGRGRCCLVDLHLWGGDADLHLDLEPHRDWTDLLPVAGELTEHHLELALTVHGSGLGLLAAPAAPRTALDIRSADGLLSALSTRFEWLIIDGPAGSDPLLPDVLRRSDMAILVTTADPPALRGAARVRAMVPYPLQSRLGLVVNQMTRSHPASPSVLAESLEARLLAVLPRDPQYVGYQVNYGQPAVLSPGSSLGREIVSLVRRLESWQATPSPHATDGRLTYLDSDQPL